MGRENTAFSAGFHPWMVLDAVVVTRWSGASPIED